MATEKTGYFCIWVGASNFQLFAVFCFIQSTVEAASCSFPSCVFWETCSVTDVSLLNSGRGRTEQMIRGLENAFNGRNLSSSVYLIKLRNEENLNPGPCEFKLRKGKFWPAEMRVNDWRWKKTPKLSFHRLFARLSINSIGKGSKSMGLKLVKYWHDSLEEMAGPSRLEALEMKANCL